MRAFRGSQMPPQIAWPSAERQAHFERWLAGIAGQHGLDPATLSLASADASFRRYLRVQAADGGSRIVMDAPPPQEDVRPFIDIAGRIAAAGLHAPAVLASDAGLGFVLLTDLGSQLYLPAVQAAAPAEADRLMREAVTALVHWQRHMDGSGLPAYDDALQIGRELALFPRVVRAARVRPDLDRCPAGHLGQAWCNTLVAQRCWTSPPWWCTATGCHAT
jgi:aminoglycoside/choline kinase family phosphotransferase